MTCPACGHGNVFILSAGLVCARCSVVIDIVTPSKRRNHSLGPRLMARKRIEIRNGRAFQVRESSPACVSKESDR